MNSWIKGSLLLACVIGGNVFASTLRVTCEGPATGAEVSINGKFRGECPVDIQVAAGKLKLTAAKKINGKLETFEQEMRLGDGVAKRVEVSFDGAAAATVAAAPRPVDRAAIARARYVEEKAEYDRNIQSCLPKHAAELRRMRERAISGMDDYFRSCKANARQNGKPSDWSWEGFYHMECGKQELDDRLFGNIRLSEAEKEFKSFDKNAKHWCGEQFTEPFEP